MLSLKRKPGQRTYIDAPGHGTITVEYTEHGLRIDAPFSCLIRRDDVRSNHRRRYEANHLPKVNIATTKEH